jgi:hypothetical protein
LSYLCKGFRVNTDDVLMSCLGVDIPLNPEDVGTSSGFFYGDFSRGFGSFFMDLEVNK